MRIEYYRILAKQIRYWLTDKINEYILSYICNPVYKLKYNNLADPDKNIYINISDIHGWYKGSRLSELGYPGYIKGGDWSKRIVPFNDVINKSIKYKSIEQRFVHNIPWRETDLFKKKKDVNFTLYFKRFNSLNEYEIYYEERYNKIYNSLKNDGVIPATAGRSDIDPIYINIDKNGEILYTSGGNHRLYMCIIIGITQLPVKVRFRHKEWQRKREYILKKRGNDLASEYIHYLEHPDIKPYIQLAPWR